MREILRERQREGEGEGERKSAEIQRGSEKERELGRGLKRVTNDSEI